MDKPISIEVDGKTLEYFTYAFTHAWGADGKEILDALTVEQLKVVSYVAAFGHLCLMEKSKQ